jgi:hypothetical protein
VAKPDAQAEPPNENVRMALIGIVGAAAAFFMFGGLGGLGKTGTNDPLDAIPKASFMAATLDFAELRRSPIYDAVFGNPKEGGPSNADPMRRALGVTALADACGFDPTSRVQRLGLSMPEEGERGEFGVAARVEVTRDELEKCTRALAEKRGGHAETHDVGSFVVLEDSSSATGGSARPRIAYGRGGLLVVGRGTWFDAMLGAADRTKPGLREAAEHVALRASLTRHDGFKSPTLLVTALLPRTLRERLKGEMGAESGSHDSSSAIMAGVLGVSAVGVAIHAGGPGQSVDASLELVCDSPEGCEAVEKLAQKKRGEWSRDLSLRMVGLGPLLDSFELKREGAHLRATASAGADALAATIERVMKLRARRSAADGPPNDAPRPRAPLAPGAPAKPTGETLPARPDGG